MEVLVPVSSYEEDSYEKNSKKKSKTDVYNVYSSLSSVSVEDALEENT